MPDLTLLEERLAHLERTTDDLSDIVSRQAAEIARLHARVAALMEREAERLEQEGQVPPLADRPPPHW